MKQNILLKLIGLLFFLVVTFFIVKKTFFSKKGLSLEIKDNKYEEEILVVNVLDQEDFDDAHIKNSILVTMDELPVFLSTLSKSTILIFYCANYLCTSSDEAAISAIEDHFSNVYVYKGGMADWYQLSKENDEYKYDGPAVKNYLNIIITPKYSDVELKEMNNKFSIVTASEVLAMMKKYNIDK